MQVFSPAPRKGNLVARLHGTGARKPILLVAHLDVVPALREDWSVDPFKLTEQDGYYYARGTSDDKYMAASFVTNLIRYKQEGYKPDRDIIVALETDEEILDHDALGIQWLLKNHRDLIDAEFALNEGGGVGLKDGKAIRNSVQTSEKVSVSFQLEVKNSGGHCSVPRKDNAIYRLAEGLVRLSQIRFSAAPERDHARLFRAHRAVRERADWRPTCAPCCRTSPIRAARRAARRQSRSTTRSCAPPASRPCCRAATPSTRCRSLRPPRSIAGSCRASRSRRSRRRWSACSPTTRSR